ncbi:MAG: DUF1697 domain-containing protein [Rhizobiaceae bacterium]|nr:DUF1697 domain-containing protein [Rhizobiaceae bacterium]
MTRFVAFLRGINVGGHRKIKMAELKQLHENMGHENVATYLQSGNVVFDSDEADRAKLIGAIEQEYRSQLDVDTHVILRCVEEMIDVIAKLPFPLNEEREAKFLNGIFLSEIPASEAINSLMQYEGPEEIQIIGDVLYVYYTDGSGRSKFNLAFIEKNLKVRGTARNWNSISKILELMKN